MSGTNIEKSLEYVFTSPILKSIKLPDKSEIIVIGIAGGSGSGKTTLAKAIYESIGESKITYISHDSYYKDLSHLPIEERCLANFDHPDSLDTELLIEHIMLLKNKQDIAIPTYDYVTHTRKSNTDAIHAKSIILLEGILIFSNKELYDLMDIKIFVDTDDDIRIIRRIQRKYVIFK